MQKIPPRFEKAKWSDVPKQIQKIVNDMPKTRKGIYLHGKVGTGKTHMAYAIYEYTFDVLRKNVQVHNSAEMLSDIRDCYEKRFDGDFIDELKNFRGLLIIDDIGSERINDWVLEQFYLIVNKRYNEMLPTIFTSNWSIQELSNEIGERVASRIVEMCEVVELSGDDKRLDNFTD